MNDIPPASEPALDQPAPRPQSVRVVVPQSAPYVTYAIIGVTAFVFLLQLATESLLRTDVPINLFVKSNDLIRAGQIWRLLTPMLLHGSFIHIGFNMYALWAFRRLERDFGHGRFLLLYLLGAFAGNVASFLLTQADSLGASTAIFGLFGAEAVFLIQNRKLFPGQFRSAFGNILFFAVLNLVLGFSGTFPGIDNWGHVGGLLGGLLFSAFAGPRYAVEGIYPAYHLEDQRSFGAVIAGAAMVVLVFGGLALWGMVR